MRGQDFDHDLKNLFQKQNEIESTIDMENLTLLAGGEEALREVTNGHDVSTFFVDPTLFSLLRQYNEDDSRISSYNRVRMVNGDPMTKRKPQAKDVLPNRILEEQDEQTWQEAESIREELEAPTMYPNPHVPKKRRYHADSTLPSILRPLENGTPSRSSSVSNIVSPRSTPIAPICSPSPSTIFPPSLSPLQTNNKSQDHTIFEDNTRPRRISTCFNTMPESSTTSSPLSTSITAKETEEISSSSSSILAMSSSSQQLSMDAPSSHPTVDHNNISSNVDEAPVDEEESSSPVYATTPSLTSLDNSNEPASSNPTDVSPTEPSTTNHPDIPETFISKKFMEMATKLQTSPLRSIKKKYYMDVPPRHRKALNYAIAKNHIQMEVQKQQDSSGKISMQATETIEPEDENKHSAKKKKKKKEKSKKKKIATESMEENHPLTIGQELIFTISIYQANKPSKLLQEFQLLGSQNLTDLRDALYCRMDFTAHGDRQGRQPEGQIINTIRQKLSASFFYIGNTFYVDERNKMTDDDDDDDPSQSIRQWIVERSTTTNPPEKKAMNCLSFSQLSLELNHPYLFYHQQNCQHIVMIRDIRLLGARDELNRSRYPVTTYSWRYTRYKCTMCAVYPAVYVTTNDYLSGFSPCYFCDRCYGPFHFDSNGNPVSKFDVHPYHGS